MNKYYWRIIAIVFIVINLMVFAYSNNLNLGFAQIFLIIAGGYGIYLNLKAHIK